MEPTNRFFTNIETGIKYRLCTSQDNSKYHLMNGNNEVNGFYISAHTGAHIKLNTGKVLFVNSGEFYNLKDGEKVTHRKFIGFSKFSKF